ncbi:hypothetical protein [Streptomyces swartbergensis]|uniref:hypothetical protein n=1 Tax=Streptomyces swartbergensis TaxID=487165 RepID=UPI0038269CFD
MGSEAAWRLAAQGAEVVACARPRPQCRRRRDPGLPQCAGLLRRRDDLVALHEG